MATHPEAGIVCAVVCNGDLDWSVRPDGLIQNQGNAYDSLAKAFMENGNKGLAIENYRKSLELDPSNTNAVDMLKKLGAK